MMRRKRLLWCVASLAAVVLLAAVTGPVWLPWVAKPLMDAGPPQKADVAVVLGGDGFGKRLLGGAELVKQGYVSKAVVSGPDGVYGFHESELAIEFGKRNGYPESYFLGVPHKARSTEEESVVIVDKLRQMNVHSIEIVTSDFHTRRAGRIFRRQAPDMKISVVSVPSPTFDIKQWWKEREGRKAILLEWSKTFAGWLGM